MLLKNMWATQFPLIKNLQITSINIYPYQIKKLDNSLQIDAYIETANSFQWFFFWPLEIENFLLLLHFYP